LTSKHKKEKLETKKKKTRREVERERGRIYFLFLLKTWKRDKDRSIVDSIIDAILNCAFRWTQQLDGLY
jgi:hypothetical protein